MTPPGISSSWFSFIQSHPEPETRAKSTAGLDFDAGINASTAWTEHIDVENTPTQPFPEASEESVPSSSLSDDEMDDEIEEGEKDGRSARVLYVFEGKPEFRELSVDGGDEIEVVKEEAGGGWSLVKNEAGEMGLLPRAYYTFTVDFLSAPEGASSTFSKVQRREASTASLTPRGSPTHSAQHLPATSDTEVPSTSTKPIQLQTTGERMLAAFPSFRQSLLGGRNLNRFSSFVTSGAEAYVLKGDGELSEEHVLPSAMRDIHSLHERGESEESCEDDNETDGADGQEIREASPRQKSKTSEADRHYIESGPSWKSKVPPFRILVHSPSRRSSTLSGAYTIYSVTSLFQIQPDPSSPDYDPDAEPPSPTRITVHRRFSHFVVLHTALTRRLPGIALPPLPEKQYAGRFNDDFVEARRGDLERYLARIVRHPVARYAEFLTFFLGCESEIEWKRQLPRHLALPPAGPSFYANVFHPAFNIDADEAEEVIDRFDTHIKAVGTGVQGLRNVFGQIRQARIEMSKAERLLSYSLLSLITSKPLAATPNSPAYPAHLDPLYDPEYEVGDTKSGSETTSANRARSGKKGEGLLNEEGAWCWREGCEECLELTKALQKTSETLQSVADLYDDHARRTQLATHESLKGVAHPLPIYAPVVDTHRNVLSRYSEATNAGSETTDEKVAARCETVLNTTMAEIEIYHSQKVADFTAVAKEHLDGEIEFYEQILNRLRTARRAYDQPSSSHLQSTSSGFSVTSTPIIPPGPRQQSIYERELAHPRLNPDTLPQPCPHVYDSAPMRPVSHAIQQGVGLFLGGSGIGSGLGFGSGAGRTSVLGRLGWGN